MSVTDIGAAEEPLTVAKHIPTLRADFVWTFVGNGVYAACQWAVLVLLAKTGTPELVGQYAFAVAVATPVITFANLQLRSVQASDMRGEFTFRDYLGFRLWTTAAALALLTLLCVCMRYSPATIVLVEAVGLALAVEAISDVYYGLMQNRLRMDRIAKSMIMRAVLSLLALVLTMYWTHNLILGVVLMAAARLAVAAAYDLRGGISGLLGQGDAQEVSPRRPRWSRATQVIIFRTAFPVGFVAVLVSFNTYIPRYFIEWSVEARELRNFFSDRILPVGRQHGDGSSRAGGICKAGQSLQPGNGTDFHCVAVEAFPGGFGFGGAAGVSSRRSRVRRSSALCIAPSTVGEQIFWCF